MTDPLIPRTADQLIAEHIQLDDGLAAETKRFNEWRKPYTDRMEAIKNELRAKLAQENGLQEGSLKGGLSFKTGAGTAYTSEITTPSIVDREAYIDFCMEQWDAGGNEMLQVGKPQVTAVKTYMQEHEGVLPPGVKVESFIQVNIRRS